MDFPRGLLTMVTGWRTFCTSEDYGSQILLTLTSDGCMVGQHRRGEKRKRVFCTYFRGLIHFSKTILIFLL